MITLTKSLQAWGSAHFKQTFKSELILLDPNLLPLQKGLSHSSYLSNEPFSPVILNTSENDEELHIKSTIFYTGIIAGCSCADDPTPQDLQNESCDVLFRINKLTAETQADLI